MCAVITMPAPASMPAANGTSSTESSRAMFPVTVGSDECESTSVSPCPGKCLIAATTPASCEPLTNAAASAATRRGSSPNERVLMTGFDGLLFTSTVGAKFTRMPIALASRPIALPTSNASDSRPVAAIAMALGKTVAPPASIR